MNNIHNIGKVDAIAEYLMRVRMLEGDTKQATLQMAQKLLEYDPEHPHALWVMDNVK